MPGAQGKLRPHRTFASRAGMFDSNCETPMRAGLSYCANLLFFSSHLSCLLYRQSSRSAISVLHFLCADQVSDWCVRLGRDLPTMSPAQIREALARTIGCPALGDTTLFTRADSMFHRTFNLLPQAFSLWHLNPRHWHLDELKTDCVAIIGMRLLCALVSSSLTMRTVEFIENSFSC
jgi:hypothetical protein